MTLIRQHPAGEAGHDDGAMSLGKRGAHSTARRAYPITFYLPIDDKYRLTADERCWRIEQLRKDGEWRPVEYYMTLEALLKSLSERLLRTSKVRTLADALAAVENVACTLTRALAASTKVER